MKRSLSVILGLAVVLAFSSCTQRQYGHLTGLQFNTKKEAPSKRSHSHYVKTDGKTEVAEKVIAEDETAIEEVATNVTVSDLKKTSDVKRRIYKTVVDKRDSEQQPNRFIAKKAPYRYSKKATDRIKPIKKFIQEKSEKKNAGIIYWILVVILILLILTLLRELLGALYPVLILVVLILLILHLLGMM